MKLTRAPMGLAILILSLACAGLDDGAEEFEGDGFPGDEAFPPDLPGEPPGEHGEPPEPADFEPGDAPPATGAPFVGFRRWADESGNGFATYSLDLGSGRCQAEWGSSGSTGGYEGTCTAEQADGSAWFTVTTQGSIRNTPIDGPEEINQGEAATMIAWVRDLPEPTQTRWAQEMASTTGLSVDECRANLSQRFVELDIDYYRGPPDDAPYEKVEFFSPGTM